MRVGRNAAVAHGGQRLQFGQQRAVLVKQFLRLIAAQPFLELGEVFLLVGGADGQVDGHLVRAERTLDGFAVDDFRPRPALGRAQHDHRPLDVAEVLARTGAALDVVNFLNDSVQRLGHLLVHRQRVVALDKIGLPRAAEEEMFEFLVRHAAKDGRIADFVAVQVQDGQHRAVTHGVQEFVALPAGRQRAGLGFAVADGDGGDEVGVIEHRAKGVGDGIAQLAALVDGARRFGRDVGRDAAGEAELLEQAFHALLVAGNIRVDFGIGAVEVGVGDEEVAAVPRAGDQDHILVILFADAV